MLIHPIVIEPTINGGGIFIYPFIQAEKLLQDILEAGLTPNVVTYTALMVVLRKSGQYEKAIGIINLMQSKVSRLDVNLV